jgi:hypothetical protein
MLPRPLISSGRLVFWAVRKHRPLRPATRGAFSPGRAMATTKNPPSTVTCGNTAADFTLETNLVAVLVRNRDATNAAGFNLKQPGATTNPAPNGDNAIVLKAGQEARLEANGNDKLAYINQATGQSPVLEITQFVQT